MSDTLKQVIERASTDAAFRAALASDPRRALASYNLGAEERAALMSVFPRAVQASGLDIRVTKLDNPAAPGETFYNDPWH